MNQEEDFFEEFSDFSNPEQLILSSDPENFEEKIYKIPMHYSLLARIALALFSELHICIELNSTDLLGSFLTLHGQTRG